MFIVFMLSLVFFHFGKSIAHFLLKKKPLKLNDKLFTSHSNFKIDTSKEIRIS